MIPPIQPALRIAQQAGVIAHDFHRWLQLIQSALHGPFIGQQATGTVAIGDGEYGLHGKRLTLAGKHRLTIKGTGRLVLRG